MSGGCSTAGLCGGHGRSSPRRWAIPTSTSCTSIPRACGPRSRRPGRGGGPTKKEDADARRCLGRSQGGLTTKIHAAVDARVVKLRLTPGQRGDAPQGERLLDDFRRGQLRRVTADAAYDSGSIRRRVRSLRAKCCIKPNPARKAEKRYDRKAYKRRNVATP
ncbi:MAG: transposase [Planctomycetota bacterium]